MGLLTGVRVLSVEQYGAGPFGTQLLADMGAEVIKVEQPRDAGDVSRHVGPVFDEDLPPSAQSLFFQSLNRGKRSLCIDLQHPEGRRVLHALVRDCHVVASNLRGDVSERLGLTYAQLQEVQPRVVCAHLTGYGREGSRATWPGYDYLMQAEAGYFALTGEPDAPPARMGLSIVDYMSGVMLALAITSALVAVQREGHGRDVDVALYDVALFNLNYVGSWYLHGGLEVVRQPRSAHPSLTPCQLYRTADGWIYLMCNKPKFWRALCACVERPQWAEDPRLADFAVRLQHRDLLTDMLDGVLGARGTQEWMAVFAGKVPAAPILSVAQALTSPFAQERGCIEAVPAPAGPALRALRSPIRVAPQDQVQAGPAPALGEHTAQLLAQAGFDAEQQATLKALGVLL